MLVLRILVKQNCLTPLADFFAWYKTIWLYLRIFGFFLVGLFLSHCHDMWRSRTGFCFPFLSVWNRVRHIRFQLQTDKLSSLCVVNNFRGIIPRFSIFQPLWERGWDWPLILEIFIILNLVYRISPWNNPSSRAERVTDCSEFKDSDGG